MTFRFAAVEIMTRIEIWKSTPSWRTLSPDRQRMIVQNLNVALSPDEQNRRVEEEGPFLVDKKECTLLIWSSELDIRRVAAPLDKYFEPIASTAVTDKITARTLASKLAE